MEAVTPQKLIGCVSAVLSPVMGAASMFSIVLAGYLDSTVLCKRQENSGSGTDLVMEAACLSSFSDRNMHLHGKEAL